MRLIWAEKALPIMLIILGGLLATGSLILPQMDSIEVDLSELLPDELEIPIPSYTFNITIDSPLIGKAVIPVEIGGSKVTVRLSEVMDEQKIEIKMNKLSYLFLAIRFLLVITGITLIVAGLAIRSILV